MDQMLLISLSSFPVIKFIRLYPVIASEFSSARNAFCIIEVREKADKIEIYSVLNNVQKSQDKYFVRTLPVDNRECF